jgi:hypothetical protein
VKAAEADMAKAEKLGIPTGLDAIHPLTGKKGSNLDRKFCFT